MQPLAFFLASALVPSFLTTLAAPQDYASGTIANDSSVCALEAKYQQNVLETLNSRSLRSKCNSRTVLKRKEWGSISKTDRLKYTKAVKCLYKKPSQSDRKIVPGARNRLDDFVATHIQQSNNMHFNGYLFAWHRHFIWLYDQALRNECGYTGPMPYWDWTLSAEDPRKSPVFDGGKYSMGSNGKTISHGATIQAAFGIELVLPAGTGGGCVTDGPFTDLVVNLGLTPNILAAGQATNESTSTSTTDSNKSALDYNPRCLTRDINLEWSVQTRTADVEFLLQCDNVKCLEERCDGWETTTEKAAGSPPQLHPAGHFSIGGLQNDPFASPGDPVFYMHHAQLDRMWSIWQGQDPETRTYQVGGAKAPFNNPPSGSVSATDKLSFGIISPPVVLKDAGSTIDGTYCYIYE